MDNLAQFANDKPPLAPKAVVIALLIFSTSLGIYYVGNYDTFTPNYTNGFYWALSILMYTGIVVGPACLWGLRAANYAVYTKNLDRFVKSKLRSGAVTNAILSYNFHALVVPGLVFWALTWCE